MPRDQPGRHKAVSLIGRCSRPFTTLHSAFARWMRLGFYIKDMIDLEVTPANRDDWAGALPIVLFISGT